MINAQGEFTNLPEAIAPEAYEKTIDYLADRWSALSPKPLAIYQIGEISTPGISDLDFILVFPNNGQLNWADYEPNSFPDWVRRTLTHEPYCCTLDAWSKVDGWFPAFDYRHIRGEHLDVSRDPMSAGLALGFLVDYAIVKNPVDFLRFSGASPVSVRNLLLLLNSAKYTVKLAEQAGVELPENAHRVVDDIAELRNQWFRRDLNSNLELFSGAYAGITTLCGEVIQSCGRLLGKGPNSPDKDKVAITDGWWHFEFVEDWSLEAASEVSLRAFRDPHGRPVWQVPWSFLAVLNIYADECPAFRKYFQLPTVKTNWDSAQWDAGLRYHARAMLSYAVSSTRLRVPIQKYISYSLYHEPSLCRRVMNRLKRIAGS